MKNPELAFDLDETRLARGAAPVPPIPEPLGPTDFQHFLAQANAASASEPLWPEKRGGEQSSR